MNKILVSRIGEIVKRKLNGNRLFGNSFTTLQAVPLFPQIMFNIGVLLRVPP